MTSSTLIVSKPLSLKVLKTKHKETTFKKKINKVDLWSTISKAQAGI